MRTGRYTLGSDANDSSVTLYRNLQWALVSSNRPRPSILVTPIGGGLTQDAPVMLVPSPLVRSASAPPDYIPSLPASRQHRSGAWAEVDRRSLPVPPEVVETRRREKECSQCCVRCVLVVTTLRWLLVSIALLGAACVVAGIVFGVMSSTLDKNTFFVLSFTFIGLGIVLVVVVCVGWRCAPAGHEPCHSLCHLARISNDPGYSSYESGGSRTSQLMHRTRDQWYAGFLYPDFHYGTPPPSYATSMEQYRQRMHHRRNPDSASTALDNNTLTSLGNGSSLSGTPPPSYRSRIVPPTRVRPSIRGIIDLQTTQGDLPPPYQSASRRSSADGLASLAEVDDGNFEEVVNPTDDQGESDVNNTREPQNQVEESSSIDGGLVVNEFQSDVVLNVVEDSDCSISYPAQPTSILPPDLPPQTPSLPVEPTQTISTVRSMVKCFENLTRIREIKHRTTDFTENLPESRSVAGSLSSSTPEKHNHNERGFMKTVAVIQMKEQEHPGPSSQRGSCQCAGSHSPQISCHLCSAKSTFPVEINESNDLDDCNDDLCFVVEPESSRKFSFIQTSEGNSRGEASGGCHGLSRGQSLEDTEIGESGI